MEIKKIIITGAAGYIGSHLIKSFLDKNYKVIAGIHINSSKNKKNNFYEKFNKKIEIFEFDMKER